jgi:lysophospholipase L1-like esterase
VSKNDDYRRAWTTIAQGLLGLPVANAGVNGQGVEQAIAALGSEVFTLQGITDCIVVLGTNNLATWTADQIEARLAALFDQLRPFCHVWAGTLLPKERTPNGTYADVVSRRLAVNEWIRHQAAVDGHIDFEALLAAPGDVNRFAPGLGSDGIHPSIAGQSVMGHEAARVVAHAPDASAGGTIQPPPSDPSSPGPPPPSVSPPSSNPAPGTQGAAGCNASGVVPSLLALMPLLAFFRRRNAGFSSTR